MVKSIEQLEAKIGLLKRLDKNYEIFYNPNLYKTIPNLWKLEKIKAFENKYNVELPDSYKVFLNQIGDGRFNVLQMKRKPEEDFHVENEFENIKKPFAYIEEWNENDKEKFIKRYKYSNGFIQNYVDLKDLKRDYERRTGLKEKEQLKLFDYYGFYESDSFIDEVYIMYYYSDTHLNGSIYLFDYGCNIRGILIVNGQKKGEIWVDDRANGNGIFPTNTTFNKWFNNLLDDKILAFEKKVSN